MARPRPGKSVGPWASGNERKAGRTAGDEHVFEPGAGNFFDTAAAGRRCGKSRAILIPRRSEPVAARGGARRDHPGEETATGDA